MGTPLQSRLDHSSGSRKRAHSRVVRISPGDSVVLNSAERAPFLLHVELLEGDLDFDPSRRENRDLLRKIVIQEDLKKRKAEGHDVIVKGLDGFGSPMPDVIPKPAVNEQRAKPTQTTSRQSSIRVETEDEPEEMDLVEQLYGTKLSVKDPLPELSETIPFPQGPKNKALDVAAWDRAGESSRLSSTLSSPQMPSFDPSAASPNGIPSTPSQSIPPSPGTMSRTPESAAMPSKRVMTLEDYSERMRTAAVMLAQLNASQIPTVPEAQPSSTGGALSWIPGTGWIRGSSSGLPQQPPNPTSSPDGPSQSQGGKLRLAAAQAAAIRDRIMEEMMSLEEERVERMTERAEGSEVEKEGESKTAEDEGIVRRELNKADPSGKFHPSRP